MSKTFLVTFVFLFIIGCDGDFVKNVHIIFMNHLDVGYSFMSDVGFVSTVLNGYFHSYFARAANLSLEMRQKGYVENFIYTTHPFLASLFVDCPDNFVLAGVKVQCPNKTELANFTAAVKRGDITWQAGPMNMQAENSDETLFQFGLSLSDRLDKKFGIQRKFKTLSQRDVPGMTQAVIPSLVKMNISAMSVGVNEYSLPPAVPKGAFVWSYKGQSVLATWHPHGYPNNPGPYPSSPGGISRNDCLVIANFSEALCFAFRTDNSGPPTSIQEILGYYEILRKEFPDAKLKASTLENFMASLNTIRDKLPVFDKEIGDTWILGVGSDPKKTAMYRAVNRILSNCIKSGKCDYNTMPEIVEASRYLVKLGEHTWGKDSLPDNVNWTNSAFQKAKTGQSYLNCSKSWDEQRQFIDLSIRALGNNPVVQEVKEEIAKLVPSTDAKPPDGFVPVGDLTKTFYCFDAEYGFGPSGAITALNVEGTALASEDNPLGLFYYATYNKTDFDYNRKMYSADPGFNKPNATQYAHPQSKKWDTKLTHLYVNKDKPECECFAIISMVDSTATAYYGAPQVITAKFSFVQSAEYFTEAHIEYNIINKTATRLAESMSLLFTPIPQYGMNWYLNKLGQVIDPANVVQNGSQYQHAIDENGVLYFDENMQQGVQFLSPDVPVVLIATDSRAPSPIPAPFDPLSSDSITGFAFNFYNNIWNTNYIYYYPYHNEERNFKSRFTIKPAFNMLKHFSEVNHQKKLRSTL